MDNLSTKLCAYLMGEGVLSLEDLKMGFELEGAPLTRVSTSELLQRLRSNVEIPLEFEEEVSAWIESQKAHLSREGFLKLASRKRKPSSQEGIALRRHNIPKETLFIATSVAQGDFIADSLDEVLEPIKQEVCEKLGVEAFDSEDIVHKGCLMKELSSMSWPSDVPIYIEEDEFELEDAVVTLLSNKAKLVIAGAHFL